MLDKENVVKAFSEFLEKHFGETKRTEVVKAVNAEKRKATFVVLKAMSDETDFDAHGDFYDRETVEAACDDFFEKCNKLNLGHLIMIDKGTASISESYISPVDFVLGDQEVPAGSWLMTLKFADDELWQGVKNGEWNGLSVGCMANVEVFDD